MDKLQAIGALTSSSSPSTIPACSGIGAPIVYRRIAFPSSPRLPSGQEPPLNAVRVCSQAGGSAIGEMGDGREKAWGWGRRPGCEGSRFLFLVFFGFLLFLFFLGTETKRKPENLENKRKGRPLYERTKCQYRIWLWPAPEIARCIFSVQVGLATCLLTRSISQTNLPPGS